MRKCWLILIMLVAGMVSAAGQGKIETKKFRLQALQEKITKVVMTGNDFRDGSIRQDVIAHWNISPFEFCTLDEFESLKKDGNWYFLVVTSGHFSGEIEPGIDFLSFVKGDPDAGEGVEGMLNIVSIPFGISGVGTGREIAMLPALLDIIQDFSLKAMERDLQGYSGLSIYNNPKKAKGKRILFAEDDLSFRVGEDYKAGMKGNGTEIVPDDEADDAMIRGDEDTVVSYTVAPVKPSSGSRCYKMLIDTGTHELIYFKRHHISGKTGSGFLPEDISKLPK